METNQNPTVQSIRHHLIIENGWDAVEVVDLLEAHEEAVNADGTTNATFEQWSQWATELPESN